MKTIKALLFLLTTLVFSNAQHCKFVIDDKLYSRILIHEIEGLPTNLAFNNHTGELFFTLIDIASLLNDDVETKMDEYVFKDGIATKIGNFNGQTAAVDTNKGIVYFGSDYGIYVYDDVNKTAIPVALHGDDIVQLYKSLKYDELYAIIYPTNNVYVISDGGRVKRKIEEISSANVVAVDKNDNIYFQSDSHGLSVLLKGFEEPISFVGLKSDTGRVLAADGDRILAGTKDGLYELRPHNVIPKKIANFDFVTSGLFVANDVFYISTSGKIYTFTTFGCNIATNSLPEN